jgi:hypothetical protein
LAALLGGATVALAQRAVHSKDAPAPAPDTSDDTDNAPAPEPLVPPKNGAPPITGKSPRAPPDAGPYVAPTFKDDLTADEIKRGTSATAGAVDCNSNPCERLVRKRTVTRELVLHLRPAQPRLGEVAEVVIEASEILDPPDPEIGEKKPMEGLSATGHLEGVGRYALIPIEGSAGSYGFHFTPDAKGMRRLTVEGIGPSADFDLPIGQPPTNPTGYELRTYEPRPGLDSIGQDMAELGAAWGGLWKIALGQSHGDAAALTKTVQRLAKTGAAQPPSNVTGSHRTTYVDLARGLIEASGRLTGASGAKLREALTEIDERQCSRCHAAFAWGLTDDVADWPSFKVVGAAKGEGE